MQRAQPAHIPLPSRCDALVQPVRLAGDLAIQLVQHLLFRLDHIVAPLLEMAKTFLKLAGLTTVQPDHRCRQIVQKTAVMADDDHGGRAAGQFGFQPLDSGQIQMVRGFVQQQDVRRRRQRAGQSRPPRFTT